MQRVFFFDFHSEGVLIAWTRPAQAEFLSLQQKCFCSNYESGASPTKIMLRARLSNQNISGDISSSGYRCICPIPGGKYWPRIHIYPYFCPMVSYRLAFASNVCVVIQWHFVSSEILFFSSFIFFFVFFFSPFLLFFWSFIPSHFHFLRFCCEETHLKD